MHAIRQYEFGAPETLRYEEVADPHPAQGQVRIAVSTAGVHLIDTAIRRGEGPPPRPELPMTLGREVAGVIDEVGDGVADDWLGKRVVAHLGFASGGYAERAVVSVESVHELPPTVSDDVAVAMIGTGRTATAILDTAQLTSDDVAVITGAGGGIGMLLVQAARNAGATTVGLAGGAAKVKLVDELGADIALDYNENGWTDRLRAQLGHRTPTIVFDGVGGKYGTGALELLGDGGRMVVFGWSAGEPVQFDSMDVFGRGIAVLPGIDRRVVRDRTSMRELESRALAAAAEGDLKPGVSAKFALREAAEAHRALESRATVGKVLLIP